MMALIKVLVMAACYLAFDVKPGHKTIIQLRETTKIGRDENNNIVLRDPTISKNSFMEIPRKDYKTMGHSKKILLPPPIPVL